MSLFQLFKSAFRQPQNLLFAKDKSFPKTFLYLLLLSVVMFIPIGIEIENVVGTVQDDLKAITDQLPDFEISDDQLRTDQKDAGFIYQTDYLIFTFDPEGKREASDLQNDLIGNIIGVGLLKDQFVFAVTDENLLTSLVPSTLMKIPYKNIDSQILTKEWLTSTAQSSTSVSRLVVISFLIALLPIAFDFLLNILMISLLANIFNRMRRGTMRFSETFKIVSFSATIPTILTTLAMVLIPAFNANYILMVLTFFIYMRVIKPTLPDMTRKE
ncbi:DUF1189 domain-containing protein [Vagococcus sp. BWB3-3]|uniref:DUF1189 domain-containing protein n=1 Tax=Vagococcus allomyrinae TaxID=2794353 RepID=A0A940P811_9ENTE|nr:DUF1189 domain-containing protein [Vagococcus allomyrinae]MBP1041386.1 DUF1189 domain-containing protein [Vagococcus allomyrinae]